MTTTVELCTARAWHSTTTSLEEDLLRRGRALRRGVLEFSPNNRAKAAGRVVELSVEDDRRRPTTAPRDLAASGPLTQSRYPLITSVNAGPRRPRSRVGALGGSVRSLV